MSSARIRPLARPLWTALALCVVAASPVAAQVRRAAIEAVIEPAAPLAWKELVARDARVDFITPPTRARAALDSGALRPDEEELALFAIGAGEALQEWPRLFSYASEGTEPLRRAAILAMGELGVGVEAELVTILEAGEEPYASDAILALARTGRGAARERVQAIAMGGGPRAETAAESLHFVLDPLGSHELPSARYLLELRWRSAIRYGTIDGQVWEVTLRARLAADEDFLDSLVLRAAAELHGIGIRDHLLNALLERGGAARVRACVRAMPEELAELLRHRLWEPANAAEWEALVRECERYEGRPTEAAGLLGEALLRLRPSAPATTDESGGESGGEPTGEPGAVDAPEEGGGAPASDDTAEPAESTEASATDGSQEPDDDAEAIDTPQESRDPVVDGLRARILRLLAIAGDPTAAAEIMEDFADFEGEDRVVALSGLAHFDDSAVLDFLRAVRNDDDPRLRAQSLAGRARGRDEAARDELKEILADPAHPKWRTHLEMSCHHAGASRIQTVLEDLLPSLEGRERVLVAAALALHGHVGARAILREAVRAELPRGILGALAARALGRHPAPEDVQIIQRFFPLEDRPRENIELGLALLRHGERLELKALLRAAIWSEPFDRSALAARLLIETGGWIEMNSELDDVPNHASSRDLRRVGFAAGEWGGFPVYQWLEDRRRRGSADPVLQGALLGMLSTRTH